MHGRGDRHDETSQLLARYVGMSHCQMWQRPPVGRERSRPTTPPPSGPRGIGPKVPQSISIRTRRPLSGSAHWRTTLGASASVLVVVRTRSKPFDDDALTRLTAFAENTSLAMHFASSQRRREPALVRAAAMCERRRISDIGPANWSGGGVLTLRSPARSVHLVDGNTQLPSDLTRRFPEEIVDTYGLAFSHAAG